MQNEQEKERQFKLMSQNIMNSYHENMTDYLKAVHGSLTDADVILMVMNLTMAIGTNIYYSLKQFLPTTPMDFDFMKVKLINSFVDSFEQIKTFVPKDRVIPLTNEQVAEIGIKGFTIITLQDGSTKRITKEEILISNEDISKLTEDFKKEAINGLSSPKINQQSH